MVNKIKAALSSKPLHILAALSAVSFTLALQHPNTGLWISQWMALVLVLVVAVHWPLRQRGYLMLAMLLWGGWYLLSMLFAQMHLELLTQLEAFFQRALWPPAFQDPLALGKTWMFMGLPALLGLNVDYRNGAVNFKNFWRGLLLGFALGPFLAGTVDADLWLALAASLTPAWLLEKTAMGAGASKALGGLGVLAILFPGALVLHLFGAQFWTSGVLGFAAGFFLWPRTKSWRWLAGFLAAAVWMTVIWFLADQTLAVRVAVNGLTLMLICAPCYDSNWVTWLWGALSVFLAALAVVYGSPLLHSAVIRESFILPALLAVLLWMDAPSREWRRASGK